MIQTVRNESPLHTVLYQVVKVITDCADNEWPSPTIKQLSSRIGYSEETILESMEFGVIEPVSPLQ